MNTQELHLKGYERVVKATLAPGFDAIVAIHDTTLGPALGGCRFYKYENMDQAIWDVARLSEGMTYKASVAGLDLGGGKSIIIGDPSTPMKKIVMEAFGQFVDSFKGQYITAKDVGTTVQDMDWIASQTRHVVGVSGKGGSGDPSNMTALGVYVGMKAGAKVVWGNSELSGLRVAVQGLGKVGYELARLLVSEGATVIACELDESIAGKAADELGVKMVPMTSFLNIEADILAPCAMGAVIGYDDIPLIKKNGTRLIAGGANNQLVDDIGDSQFLHEANIMYCPDYVINAGGLINVAGELEGYDLKKARNRVAKIGDTLSQILLRSHADNKSTSTVARELALERIVRNKSHRAHP